MSMPRVQPRTVCVLRDGVCTHDVRPDVVVLSARSLTRESLPRLISLLPRLRTLTALDVSECALGARDFAAIARGWAPLRRLAANHIVMHAASAALLAALPGLCTLGVSGTALRDTGATAIACHATPSLRTLHMKRAELTNRGAAALSRCFSLEKLDVCSNFIGDAGAVALAHAPALAELDIASNNVTWAGFAALVGSTSLRTLSIESNDVGRGAMVPALARNTSLTALYASSTCITDRACSDIVRACGALESLSVQYNRLSAAGAAALASSASLTRLDICFNNICDAGAAALAAAPSLAELLVCFTGIRSAGVAALAGSSSITALNAAMTCNADDARAATAAPLHFNFVLERLTLGYVPHECVRRAYTGRTRELLRARALVCTSRACARGCQPWFATSPLWVLVSVARVL